MTMNPQQGWYTDPADQQMLRWWDGQRWTDHSQRAPQQPPSAPLAHAPQPTPAAASADAASAVAREVVQRKKRYPYEGIYADSEGIRCQGTQDVHVRWADAEWFGYSITNRFVQDYFMFGIKLGKPDDVGGHLVFTVGSGQKYRIPNERQIVLRFNKRTHDHTNEHWDGLVELCRKYLEPRLRERIVARIRAGERVAMGGIYEVDAHGVHVPRTKQYFPWSTSTLLIDNGCIMLFPPGAPPELTRKRRKDVLAMTHDYPNAQLLPFLRQTFGGGQ